MATYTSRTVLTRRIEYAVPSGDAIGEFCTAFSAARLDYCRRHRLDPDTVSLPDNWAWVSGRDGEVVIVFDVETVDRPMASEPGS